MFTDSTVPFRSVSRALLSDSSAEMVTSEALAYVVNVNVPATAFVWYNRSEKRRIVTCKKDLPILVKLGRK